jgi:hypothetical protein
MSLELGVKRKGLTQRRGVRRKEEEFNAELAEGPQRERKIGRQDAGVEVLRRKRSGSG